tara:strand:- start:14297 stop:14521 length:225 start_codon:yes stop_codon:yes gene_type:complete
MIESWYELWAGDEKIAAFAPITPDALDKVFTLIENSRTDLYDGKVIKILAKGQDWEELVYEEHPTVLDWDEVTV